MAFKGDLKNISLFDVFQTLNQNPQAGVLVLTRDGVTKKVHIGPDGVRVIFTRSFRPLRLGEIFMRRGQITPQDVEILLLEQKKEYRPFGQLLIESGKVSEGEVAQVLRYHAEDELFEIFGWDYGTFAFFDGETCDATTPLSDAIMDPAGLCLEAARRLDEVERCRESIPSDDEYFVRTEQDAGPDLSAKGYAVLRALGSPYSVNELRDLVGLSLYDCLSQVYALLQAGFVRPLTLDELVDAAGMESDAGRWERAARLLEMAHDRDPADRDVLERCVQAVERLGEPRRLARLLAQLGRACLDEGRVDEAVDYLEQTLRHDASNFESLCALRDAFALQEDTERAAETSLKIARHLAERGHLEDALDACRIGLESAPQALGLRYLQAQLLARTDRTAEAREEVLALIEAAERSWRGPQSKRAHDLLASCYRLLQRLDPESDEARRGLARLEHARVALLRKRNLLLRGGVAGALVAVIAVVAVTFGGADAGDLMEELRQAAAQGDVERVVELSRMVETRFPESPEAGEAARIRTETQDRNEEELDERQQRERKLRDEMVAEFNDVTKALGDRPYLEAVRLVQTFLQRLGQPEMHFLHKSLSPNIDYEMGKFLEDVAEDFADDRQRVAVGARQVEQGIEDTKVLQELENRLARVRQRDWLETLPLLFEELEPVMASPFVADGAKKGLEQLRDKVEGARTALGTLDELYFTVRRERLRIQIEAAVAVAKRRGLDLLRDCELEEARTLYATAYEMALQIDQERPREHFLPLLQWLSRRRILDTMRVEREKIEFVIATLEEVQRLREEGRAAAAYRMLRDLVSTHILIQFERRYRFPFQIESTPQGARVFVNGKPVGKTPCAIEMDIGQKPVFVRLQRAGFEDFEAQLVPTDPELTGLLEAPLRKRSAWDREISGAIEAAPVLATEHVLVATNRATLLALDLETGEPAWEADPRLLDRVVAAPVLAGEFVFLVTKSGRVHRIRRRDGNIVGTVDLGSQVLHDATFVKDTLYLVTREPRLVAIRGDEVRWSVPLAFAPSTGVVALGDRVCVGTAEGALLVHDGRTGNALARARNPADASFFGGLMVHRDLALAGAEDGRLYAFDGRADEPVWSFETRHPLNAPAATAGDLALLPARDGWIYALSPKGKLERQFDMGNAVETRPAVANGFLYAIGGNRVRSFDVATAAPWWDFAFDKEFPQHVVANEQHIVVVTNKPWIHCFAKDVR